MNDDELATMLRDSVTGVHANTPVNQIASRGRAVRARRRIPGVAAAMAGVAGAALAVVALVPSSHPANRVPTAQLAAWTVAKHTDGDIYVTINELRDPAGLQATLRADGLPVNVSFGPPLSTSCQADDASKDVLKAVAEFKTSDGRAYLVIHPSALPSSVGVSIFDEPGAGKPPVRPPTQDPGSLPPAGITGPLAIGLVHESQACTGS
jgi:hypothetical protein